MKPIFVSKPQLKVTAQYTAAKFMKPIFVSKPQPRYFTDQNFK